MGLTQAISLNICAHFEPITCYQDHIQNVKNSLHYFGDAIPDCAVRGSAALWERGGALPDHSGDRDRADLPPRRPRNAGGTAAPAAAAPAIGRAAAPSSGRPSSPPVTACPGQSPQEEEEEKGAPLQAAGNYPRSSQGYDTTPIAGHPPRATT